MDIQDTTRVITFLVWFMALFSMGWSVLAHPENQRRERTFYVGVVGVAAIHVLIYFGYLIISEAWFGGADKTLGGIWSKAIYIHVGMSLAVKEIVAVMRVRAYKQRNGSS